MQNVAPVRRVKNVQASDRAYADALSFPIGGQEITLSLDDDNILRVKAGGVSLDLDSTLASKLETVFSIAKKRLLETEAEGITPSDHQLIIRDILLARHETLLREKAKVEAILNASWVNEMIAKSIRKTYNAIKNSTLKNNNFKHLC